MSEQKKGVSNPLKIDWPLDTTGTTLPLRTAGCEAVRAISGDKAKLVVFLKTLRELEGHAVVRYEEQVAAKQRVNKTADERRAREAEFEARNTELRIKQLADELDRLSGTVKGAADE